MLKGKELFEITHKAMGILREDPKGLKMMELGSQGIDVPDINRSPAKNYFESLGIIHTSIDLDGLNGSIQLDLTVPLTEFYGKYDIVTNFGTSEHVRDQFECFKNIHYFCKNDGVMVHSVPLPGHWPKHCKYHYPLAFFVDLAASCNYDICEKKVISMPGGKGKRSLATVILKKQDAADFMSADKFIKLPIVTENYLVNHDNKWL